MNTKIVNFEGDNKTKIKRIRTRVFVEEQGVDSKIDFDGLDETATHILVYIDSNAIATGRILDDGHIGRVAVLKECRNSGAGKLVIQALIRIAKQQAYPRVYLGAQTHAVGFYKKLDFKICSELFIDAGIDHVEMEIFL